MAADLAGTTSTAEHLLSDECCTGTMLATSGYDDRRCNSQAVKTVTQVVILTATQKQNLAELLVHEIERDQSCI